MTISVANPVRARVCRLFAITQEQLVSKSRLKYLVRARQALMLVLSERTDWSQPRIAQYLKLSDHTTVRHGIKVARRLCDTDAQFAEIIADLRRVKEGEAFPPAAPITLRARKVPIPKYEDPIADPYDDAEPSSDGRVYRLNRHGNTEQDTLSFNSIRHGSRLLLEALQAARAA